MKRTAILVSMALVVVFVTATAQGALVDMNDGTVYDTDTQLSWLKDANYAKTSGFDNNDGADGLMWLVDAQNWAAGLNAGSGFAGLQGWRLPIADASCNNGQGGFNCINSEMGHLYYTELGNSVFCDANGNNCALTAPLKTGPFTNIKLDGFYWSGTPNPLSPGDSQVTVWFGNGGQAITSTASCQNYALAVRPGARSIGGGGGTPVPVMDGWWLLPAVVAGVGICTRRRKGEKS